MYLHIIYNKGMLQVTSLVENIKLCIEVLLQDYPISQEPDPFSSQGYSAFQ